MAYTGRLRVRAKALESKVSLDRVGETMNGILSDALIIPLTPKQAMDNHNGVPLRVAVVIVKLVRKVNHSQAC